MNKYLIRIVRISPIVMIIKQKGIGYYAAQ